MNKPVSKEVSEYFSALAKKRKNPHKFTTETAKEANRAKSIKKLSHEANKEPQAPQS